MEKDVYSKANGEIPYDKWVSRLRDNRAERKLDQALKKVSMGNFGNCTQIKSHHGLFEITVDYGPGLRIYCSKLDNDRFVVLNGGDKDSQQKDIDKAAEYLEDYLKRGF